MVHSQSAMSNYQSEMKRLVDGFVNSLSELWRRQAIEALGGSRKGGTGGVAAIGRARGRGAKRTSDELETLSDTFIEFVKGNPGLRIEQINKQLGTTTKDLALPIRKLLSEGAIKAKGQKRSTTYFASEGGRKRKKAS
jgi:hypothetical protein